MDQGSSKQSILQIEQVIVTFILQFAAVILFQNKFYININLLLQEVSLLSRLQHENINQYYGTDRVFFHFTFLFCIEITPNIVRYWK